LPNSFPDPLSEPADCLAQTRLLDLDDSKLRIQAMRITQLASSDAHKAVLIHDYLKSLPFGCVRSHGHVTAGEVLKSGRGDCHTKGTLFVALLRSSGVPARLRFVSLTGAFLRGIIDSGDANITHAIGEVYLEGQWIQSDTYVADDALEIQALSLLAREGRALGYGVHALGSRYWSGLQHAHGQYTIQDPSSLPLVDFGVAHDPESFYAAQPFLPDQTRWLNRAKWTIAASLINRRTQQLRKQGTAQGLLLQQVR
jgi:Transglutaminase-like superfamily